MANYTLLTSIPSHPSSIKLDILTRHLFYLLNLRCADNQGRLLDIPGLIARTCFPFEDDTITPAIINKCLQSLNRTKWIIRYEIAGIKLIQINCWWEGNTQAFAMPSNYPPPNNWIDRIRTQQKGGGYLMENWNGHRSTRPEIGKLPASPTRPVKKASPLYVPNRYPTRAIQPDTSARADESESESESELNPNRTESASASETIQSEADAAEPAVIKIFRAAGAQAKQFIYLHKTPGITPYDCWATLAWAYDQGTFRKPGVIMAENLLRGERSSADWYRESRWEIIPIEIRKAGGLVIQGEERQEDTIVDVATRISNKEPANAEHLFRQALSQMALDMPKNNYDKYLSDIALISENDDKFTIAVKDQDTCYWLDARAKKTLSRLLSGIFNRTNIEISFVVAESV